MTTETIQPYPKWSRAAAAAFVAVLVAMTLAKVAAATFPFRGGDEQGHFSYLVHLATTGAWWPDLAIMPIYDLSGAATGALNFINHPPLFYLAAEPAYALVAALGLEPSWLRAFTLVFSFAAFGAIAALLAAMRFGPLSIAAALCAALFLDVPVFSTFFNNDQFALLGGALAVFGAARRVRDRADGIGLALILAGVALASVKLTALMLVGCFAFIALIGDRARKPDFRALAALMLVGLAASAPYAIYLLQYGSPAPDTPGQTAMLKGYIAEFGWDRLPRVDLIGYISTVPALFATQLGKSGLVFLGFMALCLAPLAAFARSADETEATVSAVVRAAMIATLLVLVVHVAFAFRRYEALGWLGDLYPRYYFPLLAAYALGWALAARRLSARAAELWTRAVSAIRPQFSASRRG